MLATLTSKEDKNKKGFKLKKRKKILILLLVIILGFLVIFATNPNLMPEPLKTETIDFLTDFNVFLANQDSNISIIKLGSNSKGYVTLEGPYGNQSSQVTVAYIIGQHPRESEAHNALEEYISKHSNSLNYKYYIYKIHVTQNPMDFNEGRMNGQLLAQDFVVNDVVNKHYHLVVDIHSSNAFYYPEPYLFTPGGGGSSFTYANEIANKNSDWLDYYEPPEYTSPKYSTQPIKDNGTPAIVFEAHGEPGLSVLDQIVKFVETIDNLK